MHRGQSGGHLGDLAFRDPVSSGQFTDLRECIMYLTQNLLTLPRSEPAGSGEIGETVVCRHRDC